VSMEQAGAWAEALGESQPDSVPLEAEFESLPGTVSTCESSNCFCLGEGEWFGGHFYQTTRTFLWAPLLIDFLMDL